MTPQEAIQEVCCNMHTHNNEVLQARDMAISALEKQIPKKPKVCDYGNETVNFGCPICKRKIISKIGGDWCGGEISNCCDRCGQALDWSDTE